MIFLTSTQQQNIIELIDSICRDSMDMQYMTKLNSLYTMCHSHSTVSMTNETPSGTKKHCKSTEPESCQMAKFFFFFSQSSSKLCDSL